MCRLDDRTVGVLLQTNDPPSADRAAELHARWPAEFDSRRPLGQAFKIFVGVGDRDDNGDAAAEPGWHYGWWRGIHALIGQEGVDAGLFRPTNDRRLSM